MTEVVDMPPATNPICTWTIPRLPQGDSLALEAKRGALTVVVGANGSGKSALGVWLEQTAVGATVERLNAHRRVWMANAGPNMTLQQRESYTTNMPQWGRSPDSRWLDHANEARPDLALFDLLAHHNERNGRVAQLVSERVPVEEILAQVEPSPLERLNLIFEQAGLSMRIALNDRASFDAVPMNGGPRYPVREMSDGEKSALLLAAEVLTASPETIYILDEPERHMHRSISAGLIAAVIDQRPDCHFVALTHDLDLAAELPPSITSLVVLQGCTWEGSAITGWDAHLLLAGEHLPDGVRRAVLGGRRKVMFIEGTDASLDLPLFRNLFSDFVHAPAGGCEEVIRSVKGLRGAESLHWVAAVGIVDGDRRPQEQQVQLKADGVLSMKVNEIESLYYASPMISAVAAVQARVHGLDANVLTSAASTEALAALGEPGTVSHLAAVAAEAEVRRLVLEATPNRSAIAAAGDPVSISVPSPFPAEEARLATLLANSDLDAIVAEYPVRDSSLRDRVAKALRFRDFDDYQAACRAVIANDAALAATVRELIGELPALT